MAVLTTRPGSLDAAVEALIQDKRKRTTGTTGAHTLTALEFVNGVYKQADGGSAANIQCPLAADIVAAIVDCQVGTHFRFLLVNLDAGDAMTLTVNTGVTFPASGMTKTAIAVGAREFIGVVTNITAGSEAVEVYTNA